MHKTNSAINSFAKQRLRERKTDRQKERERDREIVIVCRNKSQHKHVKICRLLRRGLTYTLTNTTNIIIRRHYFMFYVDTLLGAFILKGAERKFKIIGVEMNEL